MPANPLNTDDYGGELYNLALSDNTYKLDVAVANIKKALASGRVDYMYVFATGTVQIPRQIQYASWPEPAAIQIAIPADEMFPPGAVPAGVNFVAELSIAADGSAEQLRLRP